MPDYDVVVTNCDQEPIHLIGEVQSYGTVVAADAGDHVIRQVAGNCGVVLGREPDALLGEHLSALIGPEQLAALSAALDTPANGEGIAPQPTSLGISIQAGAEFDCLAHEYAGMLILEFLPVQAPLASDAEINQLRQKLVVDLSTASTTTELADLAARYCNLITGYDRIMVYRFEEDGHGQVIAEHTERSDRFLGLHYPASDIPEPARRHFLLNMTRIIADVDSAVVPIHPARHPVTAAPLDLTYATIRAVSPTHIRYLQNMGVRATHSTSLVVNERLWGLIACHHYQPRRLSAPELQLCELLTVLTASFIQKLENSQVLLRQNAAEDLAHDIEIGVHKGEDLASLLHANAANLMALVEADGQVVSCGGEIVASGNLPDPLPSFDTLSARAEDGIFYTTRLADHLKLTPAAAGRCAGGVLLTLSDDGSDHLFFSRVQYAHTVNWAGDPDENITDSADGKNELSPRRSFALWQSDVDGVCRPFTPATLAALRSLRRVFLSLRSIERERLEAETAAAADQARFILQRLEASRKNSLGDLAHAIAHELSQPLTAVMNYVEACQFELTQSNQQIPLEIMDLMNEAVAEAGRAGDLVRHLRKFIEHGELELETLDLNELVGNTARAALEASGDRDVELVNRFSPDLPSVWADRVMIEQVVFNLIRNGVEAMEDSRQKSLSVSTRILDRSVEVIIRDTGPGIPDGFEKELFDPFQSTKPNGMGIGLSLCRSILRAHNGGIVARNTGAGAEMAFSLPFGE